jgi:hypothetical protein
LMEFYWMNCQCFWMILPTMTYLLQRYLLVNFVIYLFWNLLLKMLVLFS